MMEGATEAGAATFERIDPITGAGAARSKAFSVADAQQIADRAAEAFVGWSATGPNARRAMLAAAAIELEKRANDFVQAMMAETGSTEGWARFNTMLAASMIREAAALT